MLSFLWPGLIASINNEITTLDLFKNLDSRVKIKLNHDEGLDENEPGPMHDTPETRLPHNLAYHGSTRPGSLRAQIWEVLLR